MDSSYEDSEVELEGSFACATGPSADQTTIALSLKEFNAAPGAPPPHNSALIF